MVGVEAEEQLDVAERICLRAEDVAKEEVAELHRVDAGEEDACLH